MKVSRHVIAAAVAAVAWPAAAQNYEGTWKGEFQVQAGAPSHCIAKGPITVSVAGMTASIVVEGHGDALKMSGAIRSDGSWEAFHQMANGTFVTFTGQFLGQRFAGSYGAGTVCPGTFSGSKA